VSRAAKARGLREALDGDDLLAIPRVLVEAAERWKAVARRRSDDQLAALLAFRQAAMGGASVGRLRELSEREVEARGQYDLAFRVSRALAFETHIWLAEGAAEKQARETRGHELDVRENLATGSGDVVEELTTLAELGRSRRFYEVVAETMADAMTHPEMQAFAKACAGRTIASQGDA
jgi:hypothetical protein